MCLSLYFHVLAKMLVLDSQDSSERKMIGPITGTLRRGHDANIERLWSACLRVRLDNSSLLLHQPTGRCKMLNIVGVRTA